MTSGKGLARLLFFWDYDTQWGADMDRSRRLSTKVDWGCLEFENTEQLLELHAQYNVPACFAVVGAAALPGERPYHDPLQIQRIHAAGHEIASHSFYHEWLPGLNRQILRETLRRSKDALEQSIGGPVVTFVPPYNQPFDYSEKWAFSLSERRAEGRDRTDIGRLCDTLRETGYSFCRIVYQPMQLQLAQRLLGWRAYSPNYPELISGVTCVRLTIPAGFTDHALRLLQASLHTPGVIVVYGHPHSLHSGNAQDAMWLVPFLQQIQHLQQQGRLRICLPREIVKD